MALKISVERALERAREVQPSETEIMELRCLPDGQWIALYLGGHTLEYERVCYHRLECPLFDSSEL